MILVMDFEINIAYNPDVSMESTLSEAEWARHDNNTDFTKARLSRF